MPNPAPATAPHAVPPHGVMLSAAKHPSAHFARRTLTQGKAAPKRKRKS